MKTLKDAVNLPYDKIHSKYFFKKNTLFEVWNIISQSAPIDHGAEANF
jgi:hypothetical protein